MASPRSCSYIRLVSRPLPSFYRILVWIGLFLTFGIILWGAYVRASGSGAGCGDRWPSCGGELIPNHPKLETLIEFVHRASSGVLWILSALLYFLARRRFERSDPIRRAAGATLFFMTTEALVGAALVLLRLVAHNVSVARAIWMALHLLNTFLLLAAWTLLVRSCHSAPAGDVQVAPRQAGSEEPSPLTKAVPPQAPLRFWLPLWRALLLLSLFLGVSGAWAALSDTLYPPASLAEALGQDFSASSHWLIRLRIVHPLVALLVGLALYALGTQLLRPGQPAALRRPALLVFGLYLLQFGLGFTNVALLAPLWLQLVHLFVADLFWMALVWTCAAFFALQGFPYLPTVLLRPARSRPLPASGRAFAALGESARRAPP